MCRDFARDGENSLLLTGDPVADGARIMELLAAGGRGIGALAEGAFAGAAGIPDWDQVMSAWHRLYTEAAA